MSETATVEKPSEVEEPLKALTYKHTFEVKLICEVTSVDPNLDKPRGFYDGAPITATSFPSS